jgi:hypothetical protein
MPGRPDKKAKNQVCATAAWCARAIQHRLQQQQHARVPQQCNAKDIDATAKWCTPAAAAAAASSQGHNTMQHNCNRRFAPQLGGALLAMQHRLQQQQQQQHQGCQVIPLCNAMQTNSAFQHCLQQQQQQQKESPVT